MNQRESGNKGGDGVAWWIVPATLIGMKGQTNRFIRGRGLQRRLRSTSTDAERVLWQRLRLRQLDGCKFRRQHPFGDYILDFACPERMLVIELDGGQHAGTAVADAARTAFLEKAGFQVLRFWNNQVFNDMDGVLEVILDALQERADLSSATPSPSQPPP